MEYSKVCTGYILNRQVVVSSIEHIQYDIAYGACENRKARQQLQRKLASITPIKRAAILQKDLVALFKGTKTHSEMVYHFKGQEKSQWKLITHELSYGKMRYALALIRKTASKSHSGLCHQQHHHHHHQWNLFKKQHHLQQGYETIDPLPIVAKTSSLPLIDQSPATLESLVLLFETRVHRRLWKDRLAVCIGSRPTDTSHASTLFGSDFPNFYSRQQQQPPPLPSFPAAENRQQNNNNNNKKPPPLQTSKVGGSRSTNGKTRLEDILESPGEVSARMRKDQRRRDLERITSVKLSRHQSKHSSYKSAYTSLPAEDAHTAPSPSTVTSSSEAFESPMTEFPTTPPQSPKRGSSQELTPKSPNSGKVIISTPRKSLLSFRGEIIDSSSSHDDEKTLVPPLNDQRNLFRHVPPLYVQNKNTTSSKARQPARLKSMEELVNESEEIKTMLDTVYKGKLPHWHVLNGPIHPNPPSFDLPPPPNTGS